MGSRGRELEQALELNHVEPTAVLAADLSLDTDQLEPAATVQFDGGDVLSDDPADHRVESSAGGHSHEVIEQESADTETTGRTGHVDGVLNGGRIGGTVPIGTERGEADNPLVACTGVSGTRVLVVDGHDGPMGTLVASDPLLLFAQRSLDEVKGHRRLDHLRVVDGQEGGGIGWLDGSGAHDFQA